MVTEINRTPQPKGTGKQCSHCKVFRLQDNFIGKSGNIIKRCLNCRERDEIHKKQPAIALKINKHQREARRDIKYRENKRAKDEDAYLKNNAIKHNEWYRKNQTHCSEYATNNFASRFRGIKQQAQNKKIIWNDDLTDEICYQLMTAQCFYCQFKSEKTLNGIDRMDSSKNYEKSNCVSCCKICNFIKGSLDPTTFVERCQHISKHFNGIGVYHPELFPNSSSVSQESYRVRALNKNIEFSLTKEQFETTIQQNCYYCKKETTSIHLNGIDRKNNTIGYTIENCVSCCSECNYMKGCLTDCVFIESCKKIANYTLENNIVFPKMEPCLKKITKREKHEIEKTKIIITKQQPNQVKDIQPEIQYIAKQREYIRKKMPENCGVNIDEIPTNCYYIPATDKRGDGFCCDRNHPKQKELNLGDFNTTQRKSVSTKDKFELLLSHLLKS
jgi:hypothetical protein